MGETLSEVAGALRRFASGFDAALYSGDDAAGVVEVAGSIENMAAAVKALAAARVAECGSWRGGGDRSAAHYLARRTGSTVSAAAGALATARRLGSQPEVAGAALAGALSASQAAAVSEAAAAAPASAPQLMAAAQALSLGELRTLCARFRAAAAGDDAEGRRARIHARRSLRSWTDAEGAWNLAVRHNPEVGARVMAVLDPLRDRCFRAARAAGRREPAEAYGADALVEAVCGSEPVRAGGIKVIVRVDLGALLRGRPVEGEVCEIAGYGPVAVSAVRDLIDSADPFLAAVVTRGEAVVGVAHLGRRPTARQRSALEWLYPECAVAGCAAVARLELDHRIDWSRTHLTVFDLLDRLCAHHHWLKTNERWALVAGRGKRAFVAPDDPRHPRHSRAG